MVEGFLLCFSFVGGWGGGCVVERGNMKDKVHLSLAEAAIVDSIAFEFKGRLGLQSADSED